MAVKICEIKKVDLKKPVLIEGFPGLGLVGTIAASYIVEKLKMEQVGYIRSEQFPPLAAVHNYLPHFPVRIYASKKHNIIVLLSEFIVPMGVVGELADAIYDYAKTKKVSKIISLGGITIKGEQDEVYTIASEQKLLDSLKKIKSTHPIKEGATTGVTAVLLSRGAIEGLPVISFLAEAHREYMDPKAAGMVLNVLKSVVKLPLDTADLDKEAVEIEAKMKELMGKAKDAHSHYKEAESEQALHSGGMYG
jgi:uncharacterized protein